MLISRMKKMVAFLLVIAIAFSLTPFLSAFTAAETNSEDSPWDLRNFVQYIAIFDIGDAPEPVNPGYDNLYVGYTYKFVINFAEAPQAQFEYNSDELLVYQLPNGLNVENAIPATPVYHPDTDAEIGWYEIDAAGLVTVWFDNVQADGTPTPGGENFIEFYDDASFTLEILAQLNEEAVDGLDFGNGIAAGISPLVISLLSDGYSSDLSDFITSVTMYDISQDPPVQVNPGDTTYIGNKYRFVINFAETPLLQLAYNLDDRLVYQLPVGLNIPNAIGTTAIQIANGAIVGWYTIDTDGLVQVWFDDVDQYGEPTLDGSNYIDLADVTITLEIFAQLTADAGGGLDFGNNVVVEIEPPVPPPPSLTMKKTSRYDPHTERIYYMITITALGAPVRNIWLSDAPTINGSPILNDPNAFYGFRFALNGSDSFSPMDVNWFTPTFFTYYFGDLVLNPDNFITVMYYLDLPILIANNPDLVPSLLDYHFTVSNSVSVTGDGVDGVTDSTTDPVRKDFPISKSGVAVPPSPPEEPYYRIRWTITVGNGETTRLNGGTITDTLGASLFLPSDDQIAITLYDNADNIIFDGTAADLSSFFTIASANNQFTFTVPQANDTLPVGTGTFGEIYQVEIVFYTTINIPPHAGQPSIIYENNVNFNDGTTDFGTGGRVPFTPPSAGIIGKTTSGICGDPEDGYWVDYTITVDVPGGILGQPFYLFDSLVVGRTGTGVTNVPYWNGSPGVNFTAAFTDGSPLPALNPLYFFLDTASGNYNEWRLYLGANQPDGFLSWPYSDPVTITVEYRIYLDDATVNIMKNDGTAQLTNAVYLINSPQSLPIILSGTGANSVAGANVTDSWPIFKAGQAAGNPGLFNYTVTIKGGYSSRPTPLLQADRSPAFTDTFDSRLGYVPGSFYVVDTGTPRRFFAPAPGSDVTIDGSSISVNLADLQEFTSPPQDGGMLIGPAPNWFAFKRNFEVHYQLYILEPGTAMQDLVNTVLISVNPGECAFENDHTVSYTPNPLSKTMLADGAEFVHVEILVNSDGSYMFAPEGETEGPDEITARDTLTNLVLYIDTVKFYTQTFIPIGSGGIWDGVWIEQPASYNDGALWSVNVISQDVVDFVLPNQTPVKIVYDALVTISVGDTGEIKNEISIFGTSDDSWDDAYHVSGSEAGAGASRLDLRVFKQDSVGNNLRGATFNLYVTILPDYSAPTGLTNARPITAADGTTRNFYLLLENVTTDADGIAVFSNPWINATYQLLFLLVETEAPYGYAWINDHTFFTINPRIPPTTISDHETILGEPINQISDFITIINIPNLLQPGSLRIRKIFEGLTEYIVLTHLQDFQIVITDTYGVEHVFDLYDALNPFGIVLENIEVGTYFITEKNYDVPGYTMNVSPQLPLRRFIMPNDYGEVLILVDNTYVPTPTDPPPRPPTEPPTDPTEPTDPTDPTYPTEPTGPTDPTDPTDLSVEPPTTTLETPPAPQTGDNSQSAVFIVLLIAGIIFMSGAVMYLIRGKDKHRRS